MNQAPQTQAEQKIEQLLSQLEPGSERYRILSSAKQFKSSWVDLGQQLQEVRRDRLYVQWGYECFEDYCSREIRIRRQTADKLTMAYHYLEQKNPALISQNDNLNPLPDFRSIDLLLQADADKNFNTDQQQELHNAVFEGKLSHPTIAKRFKEMSMEVADQAVRQRAEFKSALSAARRLQSAIGGLPDEFLGQELNLIPLIESLEQAVELLEPQTIETTNQNVQTQAN
ncbi:MAG: hypothetical protein BA874_02210 [Desulfuromonadales bacterium C00003068]|nr:MAG: hypothetical protein BA874_02210 [Desulfuromonadales bacterium C00003068]